MTLRTVPLLDLRRMGEEIDSDLEAAFRRVLRSGQYILGPEVDALERECASYIGSEFALGVSSGSDALILALMALGVGPGDEVICPTHTFYATAGAIWRVGARPVFVDSQADTYNCDPQQVVDRITTRTKAIIPVHLFGQSADMDPILDAAGRRGIPVIEDAAQAIGTKLGDRAVGTMGAIGCFSFFPSKNLGALGDAGLVTTDDATLAESMRVLRAHGGKPKYHHAVVGGNFRIDALQAALVRVKLPHLDDWTAARQRNAKLYFEILGRESFVDEGGPDRGREPGRGAGAAKPRLTLPLIRPGRHIFNQFVIRISGDGSRDRLQAFLKERGVGTEVYYPVPMHLQKCFETLGHRTGDFPVAEAAARETVAIPIFPELTTAEIEYVAAQIREFFVRGA